MRMKNIPLALSLLLLLASCGNTRERIKEKAENLKDKVTGNPNDGTTDQQAPEPKLSYGAPFVNRLSKFIIIPSHLETLVGEKGEQADLHSNLLFFNPETGEVNALDTGYVGFIENFSVLCAQPVPKDADGTELSDPGYRYIGTNGPSSLIFMEVANSKLKTDKSSNLWGSLYGRGATSYNRYLAVANDDGKNFTPLTPPNSAALWWEFIQNGGGFLASAVVDSDNNGKIEDSDKVELFYTNLQKPELGRTIVPAALQQTLTSDYIKRKKEFDKN